mgnify:CR=1 FL=1
MQRSTLKSCRLAKLALALVFVGCLAKAEAAKPNIIFIMADDLGYGDIGCYGAKPKNLKTPQIDKLAANGLRFTSGYCSASTCTVKAWPTNRLGVRLKSVMSASFAHVNSTWPSRIGLK